MENNWFDSKTSGESVAILLPTSPAYFNDHNGFFVVWIESIFMDILGYSTKSMGFFVCNHLDCSTSIAASRYNVDGPSPIKARQIP